MASSSEPPTAPPLSRQRSPPSPPWEDLPQHITASIIQKMGAIEMIMTAQKVCTTWRKICQEPYMWRVVDMEDKFPRAMPYKLEKMCRLAVDRSQGQLVDINIEKFGTDKLLAYIAERSPELRRLQLSSCYGVSGEGLREAVKAFPLLEELHLNTTSIENIDFREDGTELDLTWGTFSAIGISCPLLKSFKYNKQPCKYRNERDEAALAIGASMPTLRHLQLIGNKMTNKGLQAILDGCSLLESLDVRGCFNLDFRGELGARCLYRIKDLRLPDEPLRDCPVDFRDPLDSLLNYYELSDSQFCQSIPWDYEDWSADF